MVNKIELLGPAVNQLNTKFDSQKAFKIKEPMINFPHYCIYTLVDISQYNTKQNRIAAKLLTIHLETRMNG